MYLKEFQWHLFQASGVNDKFFCTQIYTFSFQLKDLNIYDIYLLKNLYQSQVGV